MEHSVKIMHIKSLTHNVKSFILEKPAGYRFEPGQATEVAINKPEWKNEKRPFTFTCLNSDPHLEFVIKGYPQNHGVTDALHNLKTGDELLIHDVWGAIEYKGEGVFIAGGAGITPFIAILRQLYKQNAIGNNKLIFSNKTSRDIILREEFDKMLGKNFINVLTGEKISGMHDKRIDKDYLKEVVGTVDQQFYVCGPDAFTSAINQWLIELGAKPEMLVFEK